MPPPLLSILFTHLSMFTCMDFRSTFFSWSTFLVATAWHARHTTHYLEKTSSKSFTRLIEIDLRLQVGPFPFKAGWLNASLGVRNSAEVFKHNTVYMWHSLSRDHQTVKIMIHNIWKHYTLKFQCLLIDLRLLIGLYPKFY